MTTDILKSLQQAKRLAIVVTGPEIPVEQRSCQACYNCNTAELGILATEFIWARNLLSKIHNKRNVRGGTNAKEAE